jgi:hypothetical protein
VRSEIAPPAELERAIHSRGSRRIRADCSTRTSGEAAGNRVAGLLENDVGDALRGVWEDLASRPGEHPLQPYIDATYRWTAAWKTSGDQSGPHAWLALAVLQASVGYLDDDVTLEALAAIDGGTADGRDARLPRELGERRERALIELRELLARSVNDEGTEEDLRRIAALAVL